MNTLYPDATPEELAAADNVCIICREEMTGGKRYHIPFAEEFEVVSTLSTVAQFLFQLYRLAE